ncbi:MAG: hypothetical protein ACI9N9_001916 [Enterobacterales bacterium]
MCYSEKMEMIKNILLVVLLSSFATVVTADEEKTIAPKSVVDETITLCKQYATEDAVAEDKLNEYMLTCVNDELDDSDYQKIPKLPD